MGRIQSLNVWLNGVQIGTWSIGREHSFQYSEDWLESPLKRSLSLSMPLTSGKYRYSGKVVEDYFDNLLPDSMDIRRRIQARFRLGDSKAFNLLSEIGKDCVGAVQLLPEGESPTGIDTIKGRELGDKDLESLLDAQLRTDISDFDADEFRISLAGAQEKTAFLFHNDTWMVPSGAVPTTHIFKLPLGMIAGGTVDMHDSIENEWLSLHILKAFGLKTAECSIKQFGSQKVLCVKRFDRLLSNDGHRILRLPQEDFCQATGVSGALKYESDGGPGMKKVLNLLSGSEHSENDRYDFLKSQIIFSLLAAPDGHAKNFSIFLGAGDRFYLTPFYDVLSVYPVLGKSIHPSKLKMAMAVRGESGKVYGWNRIFGRHWLRSAEECGISRSFCNSILEEVGDKTPSVIKQLHSELPEDFPAETADKIFQGMTAFRGRLAATDV